jgi:uncharacterized protein YutE (UPF0331/DUF86 family)
LVDEALILRKLSELDTYRRQIDEYSQTAVTDYRSDWKTQRIVERTLQIMIEICVDIAHHIISDRKLPVPTGYADTFHILKQAKLLGDNLSQTMINMSQFRNILVHQYTDVDSAIVVDILQNRLDDFDEFGNEVIALLKSPQQ